jgi:hypothetical protein
VRLQPPPMPCVQAKMPIYTPENAYCEGQGAKAAKLMRMGGAAEEVMVSRIWVASGTGVPSPMNLCPMEVPWRKFCQVPVDLGTSTENFEGAHALSESRCRRLGRKLHSDSASTAQAVAEGAPDAARWDVSTLHWQPLRVDR